MIGRVQQKRDHRFGHGGLVDTFGVNLMPMRGLLRQAQWHAQSPSHRRRSASTAKLSITDRQDSYRVKDALARLPRLRAVQDFQQIPMNASNITWMRSTRPKQASMTSVGACSWRANSSESGHVLEPQIEGCSARSTCVSRVNSLNVDVEKQRASSME